MSPVPESEPEDHRLPRDASERLKPEERERLTGVLERARSLGFLGPGPVDEQIEHSFGFASPLAALLDATATDAIVVVDLGAGGGVPSLPLAVVEPRARFTLVEAAQRRASFLVWATVELGLSDEVEVWCGRAEVFGHEHDRRGRVDAVIARGFGPPATTVECAAPLLRPGGLCVVSEPPGGRDWPADGLAEIGLTVGPSYPGVAVFTRSGDVPSRFPRPAKAQRRAPVFEL